MRIPKLRRQREKNRPDRAFVQFRGRREYLGAWGSDESRKKYQRFIASLEPTSRSDRVAARSGLRVSRLIVEYLEHAKRVYQEDGQPSPEWFRMRNAMRHLFALRGGEPASEIGPRWIAEARARMLQVGCVRLDEAGEAIEPPRPNSRKTANANVQRIIRMLRWGVEQELIPADTYVRSKTIASLRRGQAPEREPVRPVPDKDVDAILGLVKPQVADMIRLQRLTGARPGEIVAMRPVDIERESDDVWVYRPADHKTAHLGYVREIFLGPKCIELLEPYLEGRAPGAPLFSPSEAVRAAEPDPDRKVTPRTGRKVGEAYTVPSYRRAITRACERAGVAKWTPHQLRHTVATQLENTHDLMVAKAVLGHASVEATQIYAERDRRVAREIARTES